MNLVAKRLEELGIALPRPAAPAANYVPAVRVGALLVVSGQLPFGPDGKLAPVHLGKLTPGASIEPATEAARLCALNLVAQAQAAIGDLDRVAQVVRLAGYFNVHSSFDALPRAMNGASDLMLQVFGDRGRHARTTVGVAHVPLDALCTIEAMFEIAP